MTRRWHRWLPAAVVGVVIAGGVGLAAQADSADLPEKSPEDVLTMVAEHSVEAFSGEFQTSTELGLPDLSGLDGAFGHGNRGGMPAPDLAEDAAPEQTQGAGDENAGQRGGSGVGEVLELLTGEHTARVYVDGQQGRIQVLDDLAERNVIRTEEEVWFYDSRENAATHLALPAPGDEVCRPGQGPHGSWFDHGGQPPGPGPVPTPDEVAADVLQALETDTDVTVGAGERVAGRSAYTLVLAPGSEHSLVEQVALAVDAETGFPLGVTVHARGQDEPGFGPSTARSRSSPPMPRSSTSPRPPGRAWRRWSSRRARRGPGPGHPRSRTTTW
ncbi:hypothetical protein [Sanguibacter sp. Z1732]|uniref:hypothetical protein n=1 Tax=Sanguibacter sp. Z1732 TaxID=3435412 RepID=UPI003D9CA0B2